MLKITAYTLQKLCGLYARDTNGRGHYRIHFENGPHVETILLSGVPPNYLDDIYNKKRQIGYAMGATENKPVRITYGNRVVCIEVPKPKHLKRPVTLYSLKKRNLLDYNPENPLLFPLGLSSHSKPIRLDFNDDSAPHVLNAGTNGSGKTNAQKLLTYMMLRIPPNEAQVILIDAKGGKDWRHFTGPLPGLMHPLITSYDDMQRLFAWLQLELLRRKDSYIDTPKIFVCIDEVKNVIDNVKNATDALVNLSSEGRGLGIRLVIATQHPTNDVLSHPYIKANAGIRLCGLVGDSKASHTILGLPKAGAESLTGKGDFLVRDLHNNLNRVAVAHIKDDDILALPRKGEVNRLPLDEMDIDTVNASGSVVKYFEPSEVSYALFYAKSVSDLRRNASIEVNEKTGKPKEINKHRASKIWAYANEIKNAVHVIDQRINRKPSISFLDPDLREVGTGRDG